MLSFLGFLMVIGSYLVGLWRRKRNFERVNDAGVQEFHSFGHMLRAHAFEHMMGVTSALLLIFGIGIFIYGLF